MRKVLAFMVFLGVFAYEAGAAESGVSFGAGIGALYSGLGVNVGFRSKNDLKYIAAGCAGVGYSDSSGWILPCGIGVGWIRTDLLPIANNRHGLGLYLGPVGFDNDDGGDDDKVRYGLGVTYVYFWKGVNAKGWNTGVTPAIGKENGNAKGSLLINAGYQL